MPRKSRPTDAPLLDAANEPQAQPEKKRSSRKRPHAEPSTAKESVAKLLDEKPAAPIVPQSQDEKDRQTRVAGNEWPPEQIAIMRRTVARQLNDDEFRLFLAIARRTRLDPLQKQIHGIPRNAKDFDGNTIRVLTVLIGIDGYRSIADRTGRYAPGRITEFDYDQNGKLFAARAYVMKQTKDGSWHEVVAIAFWAEYYPKKDTFLWDQRPHGQLEKCAEALALRKAFPGRFGDSYVPEEMEQAGVRLDPSNAVEAAGTIVKTEAANGKAPEREPVKETKPIEHPETVKRVAAGDRKEPAAGTVAAIKRYAVDAGCWNDELKMVAFNERTAGNLGLDRGADYYTPQFLADQVNAHEIIRTLQEIAKELAERRASHGAVDTRTTQE